MNQLLIKNFAGILLIYPMIIASRTTELAVYPGGAK